MDQAHRHRNPQRSALGRRSSLGSRGVEGDAGAERTRQAEPPCRAQASVRRRAQGRRQGPEGGQDGDQGRGARPRERRTVGRECEAEAPSRKRGRITVRSPLPTGSASATATARDGETQPGQWSCLSWSCEGSYFPSFLEPRRTSPRLMPVLARHVGWQWWQLFILLFIYKYTIMMVVYKGCHLCHHIFALSLRREVQLGPGIASFARLRERGLPVAPLTSIQ